VNDTGFVRNLTLTSAFGLCDYAILSLEDPQGNALEVVAKDGGKYKAFKLTDGWKTQTFVLTFHGFPQIVSQKIKLPVWAQWTTVAIAFIIIILSIKFIYDDYSTRTNLTKTLNNVLLQCYLLCLDKICFLNSVIDILLCTFDILFMYKWLPS